MARNNNNNNNNNNTTIQVNVFSSIFEYYVPNAKYNGVRNLLSNENFRKEYITTLSGITGMYVNTNKNAMVDSIFPKEIKIDKQLKENIDVDFICDNTICIYNGLVQKINNLLTDLIEFRNDILAQNGYLDESECIPADVVSAVQEKYGYTIVDNKSKIIALFNAFERLLKNTATYINAGLQHIQTGEESKLTDSLSKLIVDLQNNLQAPTFVERVKSLMKGLVSSAKDIDECNALLLNFDLANQYGDKYIVLVENLCAELKIRQDALSQSVVDYTPETDYLPVFLKVCADFKATTAPAWEVNEVEEDTKKKGKKDNKETEEKSLQAFAKEFKEKERALVVDSDLAAITPHWARIQIQVPSTETAYGKVNKDGKFEKIEDSEFNEKVRGVGKDLRATAALATLPVSDVAYLLKNNKKKSSLIDYLKENHYVTADTEAVLLVDSGYTDLQLGNNKETLLKALREENVYLTLKAWEVINKQA